MKAFDLPSVVLSFQNNQSGHDKLRGLLKLGPYRALKTSRPRFGFVFPDGYRDYGNRLFLALKNGIGPLFPGIENTFRFEMTKEQVFHVPVSPPKSMEPKELAGKYTEAILDWTSTHTGPWPDIFYVLHPKSPSWILDTPYYNCKASLLEQGILSQNVTFELLDNESQFGWSAANIALATFVKLGGIPWVVQGDQLQQDLIIGIGRAHLFDPISRQNKGRMAFTACFSARGPLNFLTLAEVAEGREEYLSVLERVVGDSLVRAGNLGNEVVSLTIHVPKVMGRDELEVISGAVDTHAKNSFLQVFVVKVTDESMFFSIDTQYRDGIPRRGTVIQTSDRDFMLYTEGREEKQSWTSRLPVALRVTPQSNNLGADKMRGVLRQINDLSQVNWRGLNARSKPVSIYYGNLIAEFLSHLSPDGVKRLHTGEALTQLEDRLWFL